MSRNKGIRILISVVLAFTLTFSHIAPGYAGKFSDLSGYWAEDSVTRLAALEIVRGYNGKFNPGAGVTRAEFAVMMVRAVGLADQASVVKGVPTGFTDVPNTHWASGFITVARENGVISGYPDNSFRPSALITRAEITSVLVRTLQLSPAGNSGSLPGSFKDSQDIPLWAAEAIKTAYAYKLVNGFPDGSFFPKKHATRGETAVLIERVLQRLGAEYTFYGTVQSVDAVSNVITMDISGQIESFSCKPGLRVKLSGGFGSISDIKPGQSIYIILDDSGLVVYLQAAAEPPGDEVTPDNTGVVEAQSYLVPLNKNYSDKKITGSVAIPVILVSREGMVRELAGIIRDRGGIVTHVNNELDFLFARINPMLLETLRSNSLVEEITRDDTVKAERLSTREAGETPVKEESSAIHSLNATKQAINAPEFVKVTRSDGKNQIVAVIDTGIDPGHPDLQKTSANKQKIVEWRDFTGEGDIHTSYITRPQNNVVNLAGTHYNAAGIHSVSGNIKYGYLREIDFTDNDGKNGYDLNFNGSDHDVFAVIVTDSAESGVYDSVWIDTDDDKDFTDEKLLRQYSRSYEYNSFTGSEGRDKLNFVLAQIESDGSKVNLGFDGNDHGTHVAGIIAANGSIKGVAPGAQLLSLKVLDAEGYGSLSTITEAISYAASRGAKIINLSLGISLSSDNDEGGEGIPSKLLNKMTEKYGVIFVVAAGNDGPGLNTINTPGGVGAALIVGAFNTPEMWKADYGWTVPSENLWFFSSIGPGKDGSVAPSIVAPGSAVSTVPLRGGKQYFLSEGTSIAAPHVAGAVALLMEVVNRNNLKVTPVTLKRAIETGARPISGYAAAEQGYGALNLPISWAELLSLKENGPVISHTDNPAAGEGVGFVFREGLPGRVTLYLRNASNALKKLILAENRFSRPAQSQVTVPAQMTRAVDLDISVPGDKGLFSWFITGDDSSTYGKDLEVLTTVVNPYLLTDNDNYKVNIDDEAKPAQYKRYFFKVPPGFGALTAKLTIPEDKGRAKIFLFDPTGKLAGDSGFAGVGQGQVAESVTISSKSPGAGVWECIVYSSAGVSSFGLTKAEFSLGISLTGESSVEPEQKPRDVIVGLVPKTISPGVKDYVTVQIRERFSKRLFEGFVDINGKLYYSRRGKVTLPVEVSRENLTLIVKTLPESPLTKPWEFDFTLKSGQ